MPVGSDYSVIINGHQTINHRERDFAFHTGGVKRNNPGVLFISSSGNNLTHDQPVKINGVQIGHLNLIRRQGWQTQALVIPAGILKTDNALELECTADDESFMVSDTVCFFNQNF